MKLIDTHNHLYLEDFDPEQDQLVTAAKKSGIDTLLLPNVDTTTIGRMHDLCDRYPDFTYPMMGLHPTSVNEHYAKNLKETCLLRNRGNRYRPVLGQNIPEGTERSIRGTTQMEHRSQSAGRHSHPRRLPGSFQLFI